MLADVLRSFWASAYSWLSERKHATYGLALMRIGFGVMSVVIVALYLPDFSYFFGEGSAWGEALYRSSSVNDFFWPIGVLFSRGAPDWLQLVKIVLLLLLAVVYALGWRMRVISPLFVASWLAFTTLNPVILNTGHYQTFRVMLLFLLLADTSERWSLDALRRRRNDAGPQAPTRRLVPGWVPVLGNNIAVVLIGYQLCVIYVTSAIWKLEGKTWMSGVAVYYPLRLDELTIFPWLSELLWQVTPLVFVATWLSVYAQLLFPLFLLTKWSRRVGLVIVTGMHVGIGLVLALPWFSLIMIFADMIFIRSRTWEGLSEWVRSRWRSPRGSATAGAPTTDARLDRYELQQ
jgi:hypothetical protein